MSWWQKSHTHFQNPINEISNKDCCSPVELLYLYIKAPSRLRLVFSVWSTPAFPPTVNRSSITAHCHLENPDERITKQRRHDCAGIGGCFMARQHGTDNARRVKICFESTFHVIDRLVAVQNGSAERLCSREQSPARGMVGSPQASSKGPIFSADDIFALLC